MSVSDGGQTSSGIKETTNGRRPTRSKYKNYCKEDLQKAVKDVLTGVRLQSEASLLYKIPRTTIHDNVVKQRNAMGSSNFEMENEDLNAAESRPNKRRKLENQIVNNDEPNLPNLKIVNFVCKPKTIMGVLSNMEWCRIALDGFEEFWSDVDDYLKNWFQDLDLPKYVELSRIEDEIQEIHRVIHSVKHGPPTNTVALLGQNGIGKSLILNIILKVTGVSNDEYSYSQTSIQEDQIESDISEEEQDYGVDVLRNQEKVNKWVEMITDLKACKFKREPTEQQILKCIQEAHKEVQNEKEILNSDSSKSDLTSLEDFLLPCGRIGESTTNCIIKIRYGRVYQMRVKLFTVDEMKAMVKEYIDLEDELEHNGDSIDDGEKHFINKNKLGALKIIYTTISKHMLPGEDKHDEEANKIKKFREHQENSYKGKLLPAEKHMDQIQLLDCMTSMMANEKLLDKRFLLFGGNGDHEFTDRTFIKKQLRKVTGMPEEETPEEETPEEETPEEETPEEETLEEETEWEIKRFAVKEIVLYVPSALTGTGTELWDIPGIEDQNPISTLAILEALKQVKTLVLLSPKSYATENSFDMPLEQFLQRLVKEDPNSSSLKLISAIYPEKDGHSKFTESLKTDKRRRTNKIYKQSEEKDSRKLCEKIEEACKREAKQAKRIMEMSVTNITILPLFFTKLLCLHNRPEDNFKENLEFTQMYEFMGELQGSTLIETVSPCESIKHVFDDLAERVEGFLREDETVDDRLTAAALKFKSKLLLNDSLNITMKNKNLLIRMEKCLTDFMEDKIKPLANQNYEAAKAQWEKNRPYVGTLSKLNPLYKGKRIVGNASIMGMFFGYLQCNPPDFNSLCNDMANIFKVYARDVSKFVLDCLWELVFRPTISNVEENLLRPLFEEIPNITSLKNDIENREFIRIFESHFIGQRREPWKEYHLKKLYDEVLKYALKHLIVPAHNSYSLDEAKESIDSNLKHILNRVLSEALHFDLLQFLKKKHKLLTGKISRNNVVCKLVNQCLSSMKKTVSADKREAKVKARILSVNDTLASLRHVSYQLDKCIKNLKSPVVDKSVGEHLTFAFKLSRICGKGKIADFPNRTRNIIHENLNVIRVKKFDDDLNDLEDAISKTNESVKIVDLDEALAKHELETFEVGGDGDCLYRALMHQLLASPVSHDEDYLIEKGLLLRQCLCFRLFLSVKQNKDLDVEFRQIMNEPVEDFVKKAICRDYCGTELMIAMFTDMFETDVCVWHGVRGNRFHPDKPFLFGENTIGQDENGQDRYRKIPLYHICLMFRDKNRENHYVSTCPLNAPFVESSQDIAF